MCGTAPGTAVRYNSSIRHRLTPFSLVSYFAAAGMIVLALRVEAAVTITNVSADGCGTAALQVHDGSATVNASRFTGSGIGVIVGELGSLTMTGAVVTGNQSHGIEANGALSVTGSSVGGNGGDGILVETAAAVTLDDCEIHTNTGAGVRALRAEGSGLTMVASTGAGNVHDNVGDGIVLGDLTAQSGQVNAYIAAQEVHRNVVGIRAQQKDAATAATTTTIVFTSIHDNRDSGIYVSSSFLQRPSAAIPGIGANDIFHNGFAAGGCTGGVAPQITFAGPVSVTSAQATACSVSTQADCQTATDQNYPCVWNGFSCVTAYDMRGSSCGSGSANRIYDYNVTDFGSLTVGVFASSGANVDARNNVFRSSETWQNIDSDAESYVIASTVCAPLPSCTSY